MSVPNAKLEGADNANTMASTLSAKGIHTIEAGKWHQLADGGPVPMRYLRRDPRQAIVVGGSQGTTALGATAVASVLVAS